MEISKKILGLTLCSLISFGGSQLTLLKANAQVVTRNSASKVQWEQGIKLELSNKNNPSCKKWCDIKLVCVNERVTLECKETIQDNWVFGDTFVIGVASHENNGETQVRFRVDFDSPKPAEQQLKEEIRKFNDKAPKVGDSIYMHGLYHTNTFQLSDNVSLRRLDSNSSYARKYNSPWDRGYRLGDKGLQEMIFRHTRTGVDLASKEYWS